MSYRQFDKGMVKKNVKIGGRGHKTYRSDTKIIIKKINYNLASISSSSNLFWRKSYTKTYMRMLIIALFLIVENCGQLNCPSTKELINNLKQERTPMSMKYYNRIIISTKLQLNNIILIFVLKKIYFTSLYCRKVRFRAPRLLQLYPPQPILAMKVNELWERHKPICALDTVLLYRSCPV